MTLNAYPDSSKSFATQIVKEFGAVAFTVPFNLEQITDSKSSVPAFVPVPKGYGPFDAAFDAHAARLFCRHFAKKALGAYGHNIGVDGCAGMVFNSITAERRERAGKGEMVIDMIEGRYQMHARVPGDINQHLPTFYALTKECFSVIELGMRNGQSTWSFLRALREVKAATGKEVRMTSMDITYTPDHVESVRLAAKESGIIFAFVLGDATVVSLGGADLLFIDTWHVYAQLKRELETHAKNIRSDGITIQQPEKSTKRFLTPIHFRKYIVLHDTTLDGEQGTSLRKGWNTSQQAAETGFPEEEIKRGIWPAVEEFLGQHSEWRLKQRWHNNNGLTVLERVL